MHPTYGVVTIAWALQFGTRYLAKRQLRSPREDVELLIASVLRCNRGFLYAYPEKRLSLRQRWIFRKWLAKRGRHYPLQYLRGSQEFYGREFLVRPEVFIPRPETELLLEVALDLLRLRSEGSLLAVDVGTGSGCIAVTLACEESRVKVVAIDKSPGALQVAQRNAETHQCQNRVDFCEGAGLQPVKSHRQRYHIIISNPPYVSSLAKGLVDLSVSQYEPEAAVFSGKSGHEAYLELFEQSGEVLHPEGRLVIELGGENTSDVLRLAEKAGWGPEEVRKDLSGKDRCAILKLAQEMKSLF